MTKRYFFNRTCKCKPKSLFQLEWRARTGFIINSGGKMLPNRRPVLNYRIRVVSLNSSQRLKLQQCDQMGKKKKIWSKRLKDKQEMMLNEGAFKPLR